MSTLRLILGIMVTGALAAGCGASPSSSDAESGENLTRTDGGGALALAEQAVIVYGDAALGNGQAVSCTSANGGAAALVFEQLSTGAVTTIAGAAALGKVSIVGGDGASRSGDGDVVLGVAGQWIPSTKTLQAGAAIGGYYSVATGAAMPADEAGAEALFDAALGSGARYGLALSKSRTTGDLRGRATVAFYNTGTETISVDGQPVTVAIAVGIVKDENGARAVQITGAGAYASYVK